MKFICGGQTGVDRAVLDACLENNFPCGGWCPKGRLAEDGPIPEKYPLTETDSTDYAVRTEKNVLAADATVILFDGEMRGGTLLSREIADKVSQKTLLISLSKTDAATAVKEMREFILQNNFEIINFSGPRESESKQIYKKVLEILTQLIALMIVDQGRS